MAEPNPRAESSIRHVERIKRTLESAEQQLRRGGAVLIVHNFRDTGHLVASGRHVTADGIKTMQTLGRGVLCAAMTSARLRELDLAAVTESSTDGRYYGASVDLAGRDRFNSPDDRAASANALDSGADGHQLRAPGHITPVQAHAAGLLAVPHVPEAALELARLAGGRVGVYIGYGDAAALTGISSDGSRRRALERRLGIPVVTVRDLITRLEWSDLAVRRVAAVDLPTRDGMVLAIGYVTLRTKAENALALVHGDLAGGRTLTHVHFRCPVSDVFGGMDCGCGEKLRRARDAISCAGNGVVLYSDWGQQQPLGHLLGRQPSPPSPSVAFQPRREREIAAVLRDLDVGSIVLSSNEPLDSAFLAGLGIDVASDPFPDEG